MTKFGLFLLLFCIAALNPSVFAVEARSLTDAERDYILLESLDRIESDMVSAPSLKKAVYDALPRLKGTASFVRLVKRFALHDQDAELLQLAVAAPDKDLGVEAAGLIFQHNHLELFKGVLAGNNETALSAVKVLGNIHDQRAVSLLLPLLQDGSRLMAIRKSVIRSLVQTQEGATQLLTLAKQNKLAEELKISASSELATVRWSKIKEEAQEILPPLQGKGAAQFPPPSLLASMNGNRSAGEKIFFNETTMCSRCHQVAGKGGQIGPALTEIGAKLGRDALIEAILEPSAGISFGFEAFTLTLKNGDEAYGLITSETEDTLSVKDLNGIVTIYKKDEVTKRDQSKTSIMPTGLQQTLSPQEFVDLIEYLASLTKKEEVKR